MTATGDARIAERGYQRYTGEREGVGHAVRSLWVHTLRRILGLRRPARSKLLPLMTIVFAYVPAMVFVGIVALFGRFGRDSGADLTGLVPFYSEYYGFVISAIVLFVCFVAPEALCPDRRSRLLSLYLASPLTRTTYLLAKAAAVATVILGVTLGPPLLLLIGRTLQNNGPDGFGDFLVLLLRIVISGTMLALLFTAVSLGVASLTDRRAVAAAATLFVIIGSGVVATTLRFGLDGPPESILLHLTLAPVELVARIYGRTAEEAGVETASLVAGVSLWTFAGGLTAWLRYRTLRVTR